MSGRLVAGTESFYQEDPIVPDDFREYIEPIASSSPLDKIGRGNPLPPPQPVRESIRGQVQAIRRGHVHKEGQHRLDVSVGADDTTELIVRIPNGTYSGLEGKRVIIYVDD